AIHVTCYLFRAARDRRRHEFSLCRDEVEFLAVGPVCRWPAAYYQCNKRFEHSLMALRSGNKCVLGYGAPAGHQFPSHTLQRALSSPATHLACRFSGREEGIPSRWRLDFGPVSATLSSSRKKRKRRAYELERS